MISQSLIKDYETTECLWALKLRWVDGIESEPSEWMMRGRFFEYKVLGSTRDKDIPSLPKSKRDGSPLKAELDLEALATSAIFIMKGMGMEVVEKPPVVWQDGDELAHLDGLVEYRDERAILDLKYTETVIDDRWNGWGDIENKDHLQPTFYVDLSKRVTGSYLPFYYLIFGKSGWVRLIRVKVTTAALTALQYRKDKVREFMAKGQFPASPEYNRCQKCPYNSVCEFVRTVPEPEVIVTR